MSKVLLGETFCFAEIDAGVDTLSVESPTQAVGEIVLGRENVVALMTATDLVRQWDLRRPMLLKIKDWLFALFRPTPTPEEVAAQRNLGLTSAQMLEEHKKLGLSDSE